MIEIVAKMAVNSRISTSVPGKKYSRYDKAFRGGRAVGTTDRPAPNSSQKISGWPTAPNTRFRWRKKRTNSRAGERQAASHGRGATAAWDGGAIFGNGYDSGMLDGRMRNAVLVLHRHLVLHRSSVICQTGGRCGR